jgi:hypothetical protein
LLAETKRNKFRKRSASLEPTPSPDDIQRQDSKELQFEDEVPEIRGRRSRRLSVESYFHVEKSLSGSRAHSLSPVPPSMASVPLVPLVPEEEDEEENSHNLLSRRLAKSPPRQRAMAIICQSEMSHPVTRGRSDAIESNLPPRSTPTSASGSISGSVSASAVSSLGSRRSPESSSVASSSPSPRVGVEYDFLLKYKPDNENKVHFTKRELLALRLLFSLFDRFTLSLPPSLLSLSSLSLDIISDLGF